MRTFLDGFITPADCTTFVEFLQSAYTWRRCPGEWDERTMPITAAPLEIADRLLALHARVKTAAEAFFTPGQPLYTDTFQFVRWRPGDVLHPHADSEHHDGSAHPFPYRHYAATLYLNDNYRGGELFFPMEGYRHHPCTRAGTLGMFTGTLADQHGVTQMVDGTRYTIAGFFSREILHRPFP